MKRFVSALVLTLLVMGFAGTALSQSPTLEKIKSSGVFTIGVRNNAPPFSFINSKKERTGFSNELAAIVHKAVQKKAGKPIKVEMKETTPATRIPLLTSNAVDLIAETMTDTRARRESVDFSLTFFVTGADFLVKRKGPIKDLKDIAGRRIGVLGGATNERLLKEKHPQAQLVTFPNQAAAFTALEEGKLDAFCNDEVQLYGLKYKSKSPRDWELLGAEWLSYEPYGMAMRKNDSDFRAVVNNALMEAIEGGEYFNLYEKWFGSRSETPIRMSRSFKAFLEYQVIPK